MIITIMVAAVAMMRTITTATTPPMMAIVLSEPAAEVGGARVVIDTLLGPLPTGPTGAAKIIATCDHILILL